MKLIFNQYLEIGGTLQPNFANFYLDFLSKYGRVWEASIFNLLVCIWKSAEEHLLTVWTIYLELELELELEHTSL